MMVRNMQRDLFHANIQTTERNYSTPSTINRTINGNSSGSVLSSTGTVYTFQNQTVTSGNWASCGLIIQSPNFDPTPYRIKAYLGGSDSVLKAVVIGYAPASPTGSDDEIDSVITFPFKDEFDDIVKTLVPSAGFENRPTYIGLAVGNVTGEDLIGMLSVQNLGVASPQYSASMA